LTLRRDGLEILFHLGDTYTAPRPRRSVPLLAESRGCWTQWRGRRILYRISQFNATLIPGASWDVLTLCGCPLQPSSVACPRTSPGCRRVSCRLLRRVSVKICRFVVSFWEQFLLLSQTAVPLSVSPTLPPLLMYETGQLELTRIFNLMSNVETYQSGRWKHQWRTAPWRRRRATRRGRPGWQWCRRG